jgi:hypothetical protein
MLPDESSAQAPQHTPGRAPSELPRHGIAGIDQNPGIAPGREGSTRVSQGAVRERVLRLADACAYQSQLRASTLQGAPRLVHAHIRQRAIQYLDRPDDIHTNSTVGAAATADARDYAGEAGAVLASVASAPSTGFSAAVVTRLLRGATDLGAGADFRSAAPFFFRGALTGAAAGRVVLGFALDLTLDFAAGGEAALRSFFSVLRNSFTSRLAALTSSLSRLNSFLASRNRPAACAISGFCLVLAAARARGAPSIFFFIVASSY